MSRASDFLSGFSGLFFRNKKNLFIDLGSTTTRIIVNGRLVFDEPTCISFHKNSGTVVAIGAKALASWKRTPDSIETFFPIRNGAVANKEITEKFLNVVLKQLLKEEQSILSDLILNLSNVSGSYALASGFSPLEKDVLKKIMKNVGLARLKPVLKSQSVLKKINLDMKKDGNLCVLDLGGHTSELGIMVEGQIVYSQTFYWGGDELTHRIKQIVLAKHNYDVSWEMAENIKKQIGQIYIDEKREQKLKESVLKIRGKDVMQNIIGTLTVSANDFASDLLDVFKIFIEELELAFDKVPVEILGKAIEGGIFLMGGSSKIQDLDLFLQNSFKCEVKVLKDPEVLLVKSLVEYKT